MLGSKALKSGLMLLVALTSLPAHSQDIPAWTDRGGWACYDLDSAKALKKYELTCRACSEKLQIREAQYDGCSDALDRTLAAYSLCRKSMTDLTLALKSSQKLLKETDDLLDSSEAWSIKGGALPWVITAGVVLLATGFFTGAAL